MPKLVDADNRRELIANAVFQVVTHQGLKQASLRNVADAAELALGSVRHYFSSQSELMDFSFRLNSERIHLRALERLELLEEQQLPQDREDLVEACAEVLEELLPLDAERRADAVVHMEFMLEARTAVSLQDPAQDDYRATGAVVGRVLLQLLESPLAEAGLVPVEEAQRLIGLLDGLSMRMVLQPAWAAADQGSATLRQHLDSLLRA